jgi:hypothetical protein
MTGGRAVGRAAGRRTTRLPWLVAGCLAGGALIGGVLGVIAWRAVADAAADRAGQRVALTIPAGTAVRLASTDAAPGAARPGAALPGALPPAALALVAGDTLVLTNADSAVHRVGAYSIAPGATLELRVGEADGGTFACSFSSGGSFSLTVAPPIEALAVILPATLIGLPIGLLVAASVVLVGRLEEPDTDAGAQRLDGEPLEQPRTAHA